MQRKLHRGIYLLFLYELNKNNMILPKFLIADNEDFPENTYVVHTESPRFILDVDSEEFEILDGSDKENPELNNLISQALEFYEEELERYDDEDEE